MSIKEAEAEYERLKSKSFTPEEVQKAVKEMLKNKEIGRASGCYRPARGLMDDIDDRKEPWP